MKYFYSIAIFSLILLFSGCGNQNSITDVRDIEYDNSAIRPAQPFFTDKVYIDITAPMNGAAFNIENSYFEYTTQNSFIENIYFSVFIILDTIPTQITYAEDFNESCVAGVTSNNNSSWDFIAGSINLENLYECNSQSRSLVTQNKISSTVFQTGKTYYWLLIGFDDAIDISHSSSLRQFTIQRDN